MQVLRPEYLTVLRAMSETEPSNPQLLAEEIGSIHLVLVALLPLYYDGLIDIHTYRRTQAGTIALKLAGQPKASKTSSVIQFASNDLEEWAMEPPVIAAAARQVLLDSSEATAPL
jgi:hypothetical protein